MISVNDSTIITLISKFPDMPSEEADEYISNIQTTENVRICHAILGRIPKDALEVESRSVYDDFSGWAGIRNQANERRSREDVRSLLRLSKMYQEGKVPKETMILFGISGDLPDIRSYSSMSQDDRARLWGERMENRFGPRWRDFFGEFLPMTNRHDTYRLWKMVGF